MRIALVVGGGSAGIAAAAGAKENGSRVILLEGEQNVGQRRSLLPYLLSGEASERDILPTDSDTMAGRMGIEVRLGEQVSEIDVRSRIVRSSKGRYRYDSLVLATGSTPENERTPGAAKDNVFILGGLKDYAKLADALRNLTRVAVVGSTPVSFMVAELIAHRGVGVSLFLPTGTSVGWAPPSALAILAGRAAGRGVDLVDGPVERITGVDRAEAVISRKRVHPCDGVAIFPRRISRVPQTELTLGRQGGILVDGGMRTSAESVYAAGDCVETKWGNSSLSVRLESSSRVMGTVAGTNAGGGHAQARISGVISQTIFGLEICGAGIDAEQARAVGLDPIEVSSDSRGPDESFDTGEVLCNLIFDRSSLDVCGISLIGRGANSRADAISLIVSLGMKIPDLAYFDTGYSPKNSSDLSPIALTARKAAAMIGRSL